MENLTAESFKEKVFDYAQEKEWSFKGDKPAIIDFYADWCAPCKTIAPILEELDLEYENIEIYKVNTEEEPELSAVFAIQSIPALLFVPLEGQPQMAMGALPKETFKQAIAEILLGQGEKEEAPAEEVVPEEAEEGKEKTEDKEETKE